MTPTYRGPILLYEGSREAWYGHTLIWIGVNAKSVVELTSSSGVISDPLADGVSTGFWMGYQPDGQPRTVYAGDNPKYFGVVLSANAVATWTVTFYNGGALQSRTLSVRG